MSQTKKGSFTEAITNCIIGFPLNFALNIAILPHTWDNEHKAQSAFITGVAFTGVSIFRQMVILRWFNAIKAKWNTKETHESHV